MHDLGWDLLFSIGVFAFGTPAFVLGVSIGDYPRGFQRKKASEEAL